MTMLELENVSMFFDGVQALSQVNLRVGQGEVFALVGPNGSGKSTALNCVNGFYRPQRGRILFRGSDLVGISPHQVAQAGIGRTFQNLELFSHMSVIDNVLVGLHTRIKLLEALGHFLRGRFQERWEWSRDRAFEVLDFLGLASFHNKIVGGLPFGIQKLVELARALALKPELLLLDEPAAGMNEQETRELSKLIEEIREELGITLLMVEHDMTLVIGISDRICVLDSGIVIFEGLPKDAIRDERVIEAYLGKEEDLA
jgi:branched-chain amino acid transport system ATP-binding protein